ncbi:MAG: RNA pyrophosphohydrolase [Parvibaculum sp.]|nr:RNA pyrophosphohydrolase [Parvibaculum sp.]
MKSKNNKPADPESLPYRPCVGVALINRDGLVFVGNRIQIVDVGPLTWQMPQGGIDKGETPDAAAFRELREETGVSPDKVEIIGEIDEWLTYDLPADLVGRALKGKFRGQKQRWFAMRFLGTDSDIDLAADDHQEFSDWRWAPLPEITELIVPFKRHIYERIVTSFMSLAQPLDR